MTFDMCCLGLSVAPTPSFMGCGLWAVDCPARHNAPSRVGLCVDPCRDLFLGPCFVRTELLKTERTSWPRKGTSAAQLPPAANLSCPTKCVPRPPIKNPLSSSCFVILCFPFCYFSRKYGKSFTEYHSVGKTSYGYSNPKGSQSSDFRSLWSIPPNPQPPKPPMIDPAPPPPNIRLASCPPYQTCPPPTFSCTSPLTETKQPQVCGRPNECHALHHRLGSVWSIYSPLSLGAA